MIAAWTVAVPYWIASLVVLLAVLGIGFLVLEVMYRMIDRRDRKAQQAARQDRSR